MRRFLAALAILGGLWTAPALAQTGPTHQQACPGAGSLCAPVPQNFIKSIQQVSITISNPSVSAIATISAVDLTKAVIFYQGTTCVTTGTSNYEKCQTRVELTDATTVTATVGVAAFTTVTNAVVVEFAGRVNSIQAGTIDLSGKVSGNATISAVGSCALPIWLGGTTTNANSSMFAASTAISLLNTKTVQGHIGRSNTVSTVGYMVADLAAGLCQSVQSLIKTDATTATSYTSTITSVPVANSIVLFNGNTSGSLNSDNLSHTVGLTDATTVTYTRFGTTTASRTIYAVVWTLPSATLKSAVQTGTIAASAATSATATISSVDTAKAWAVWQGFLSPDSKGGTVTDLTLTNATTATAASGGANSPSTNFSVVELRP